MLECLIPFVDYPLKLPLALFIKFNEIRLIMEAFQSLDAITALGLHNSTNSPTDMLCALTGMNKDMLNLIMTMTSQDLSKTQSDLFSTFAGMGQDFTKTNASPFENTGNNHQTNDFNNNIANIFSQYDMEQAALYEQETRMDDTLQQMETIQKERNNNDISDM
ncbi:MAG: hypothetical protein ACI4F4_11150 [Lachnospiraceae bacterium]